MDPEPIPMGIDLASCLVVGLMTRAAGPDWHLGGPEAYCYWSHWGWSGGRVGPETESARLPWSLGCRVLLDARTDLKA